MEGKNCAFIYDNFLEGTEKYSEISEQGCRCQIAEAQYYEADCFVSSSID